MRKIYLVLFTGLYFLLTNSTAHSQTVLINSGFEVGDLTTWTLANTAATSEWFIGSASASTGTRSAYITTDGGVTNSYNLAVSTLSNHIYTPVNFPAGEGAILLSFDWRNPGEQTTSTWDFIRVSLTAAAPVAGTVPATAEQLPVVFIGAGSYVRGWVVIPASNAGTTKNLVFTWRNDASGGINTPGPSIDNILLTSATPSPLSGAFTIQPAGTYTSISQAVANLNAHGVGAGGVTFNLPAGTTFNETPPAITVSATAGNPVIFQKSGAGANPKVIATHTGNWGPVSTGNPSGTGDAVFVIAGGDFITFNGIDVASADNAPNSSIIEYGYKIINASATDGAKDNYILNSSINLNRTNTASAGILQSSSSLGGGIIATAGTGSNSNNKYHNLQVQNAYFGLNLNGGATTTANTDTNNEIGTTAGGSTIIGAPYAGIPSIDIGGGSVATYGIKVTNQTDIDIFNSIVRNVGASTTVTGIITDALQGVSNVYNNKVYGIRNTSTSSTTSSVGLDLDMAATGTHTLNTYNNFISDITSAYAGAASSTRQLKGILTGSSSATSIYNIFYNSVRIDGSGSPNISSVCLDAGSSTPLYDIRNNILANYTGAQTGTAVHAAIRSTGATTVGAAGSVCNFNDYYLDNPTNGHIGITSTTNRTALSDWQTALTGMPGIDANTITVSPDYAGVIDLHIQASSVGVDAKATPITSITTDIDGESRNAATPDIGADEYTQVLGLDAGATALVVPLPAGCYSNVQIVKVAIKNYATTPLDLAVNPITVTVGVTGAVTYNSNKIVNTGVIAPGDTLHVTMPAILNMNAAGTYTFNASTTLAGDITAANNAMTPVNRVVAPIVSLPEKVNFTGFTGANLTSIFPNWKEGSGAGSPAGTTSNWGSTSSWPGGNTTAKINLDATAEVSWMVGPKFTVASNTLLKFDVAITDFNTVLPVDADGGMSNGTDDKVIVKVSTNCGVTFTDLYTFDASNTSGFTNVLTTQMISLAAFAGQEVIVAFFATDGTVNDLPNYDFHIDNINIYYSSPTDIGAEVLAAPLSPPASGCYTNAQQVVITVRNHGFTGIDFSASPLTVITDITGPVTTTLTGTLTSGVLAPNAIANVIMSAPFDMSAPGTYGFKAYTTLIGDGDETNDTMLLTTRNNVAPVTLPQTVDFTGFTGANLVSVFPNWVEATGATSPVTGSTSGWTSSTVISGSGTTAKVNLFSNTKNEWIVGPKFIPTASARLKFKVAITNASSSAADPDGMAGITSGVPTDDKVIVKISTDCGNTFSDLFTFDANNTSSITNVLQEFTLPLGAYAGQQVIIAFFATEGDVNDAPDYDFHIDDINIASPPAIDAGVLSLVGPVSQPASGCYTATQIVSVLVKNYGLSPLDFGASPLTVTTNVTGAATTTLTGILNTGVLAPDSTIIVTMSTTLDMTAFGDYFFRSYTTFAGDGLESNDTMPQVTRSNITPVTLPQTVNFTGYTGSNLATVFPNWREATGTLVPSGTTSSWVSSTNIGDTSIKINLSGTSQDDWIVGPKFIPTTNTYFRYDVAITDFGNGNPIPGGMAGTDDKVMVKISTDCGLTYTNLRTYDASNTSGITNSRENQSIYLGNYAGQQLIVAFFASDGPINDLPNYDFHIDNINIGIPPQIDLRTTALAAPPTRTCYSNAETVTVRIWNFGWDTLDFATTPVTVTTTISGAASVVLTGIVNTGSLLPDSSLDVTMSGTLDMTALGTYNFEAYLSIAGDAVLSNDTLSANPARTVVALNSGTASSNISSICFSGKPILSLTGNTGGNIQWQETTDPAAGPWINVGTNSSVYIPVADITSDGYYRAIVSCGTQSDTTNVVTVQISSPQVLNSTGGARCGPGTVDLQATASAGASLNWYQDATGGLPVGTGPLFTTPVLNSTDTFYVSANEGLGVISAGKPSPTLTTGTTGSPWGLVFNVTSNPITLYSVNIYSVGSAGSMSVQLTDNTGAVISTAGPFNYPAASTASPAIVTLPLNFSIPPGTGYRLVSASMTGGSIIRESSGNTYPYISNDGNVSITSGFITNPGSSNYYWFYDWKVSTGCSSARTAVIASIDDFAVGGTVTGDQTLCSGSTPNDLIVTGHTGSIAKWQSSNDSTFSSPVDIAVTSDTLTSAQIGPLTDTTYFRAVIQNGACGPEYSTFVTVSITTTPSATVSYTNSPYCSNSGMATVTLTGSSGGIYSSTAGLVIDPVSGSIDLGASAPGTYTVTYAIAGGGGCAPFSTTTPITITPVPSATIAYAGSPYCTNGGTATVTRTGTAGGTYSVSGSGLTIDSNTGAITLATSTAGNYLVTYKVAAADGCDSFEIDAPVVITEAPAATISYTGSPFCSATGTALVTKTGTDGGTYTASPAGLTINATTGAVDLGASTPGNYTITYTVAASNGCAQFSTIAPFTISQAGTWIGITSTDWNNSSNWCGGVPNSGSDILIPSTAPNMPVISGASGTARNIVINTGATLTVGAGGNLDLYGNITGAGVFNPTAGTVSFRGDNNQSTPAFTATNVIINGAGGWTMGGNTTITGTLTLTNGNITTGTGNLTLSESSSGSIISHIIINSTGRVVMTNLAASSSRLVPIATDGNSYNPVLLAANAGHATDNFTIGIHNGVFENGVSGVMFNTHVVNRTWTITEGTTGGSNVNITLQWNGNQELNRFDRNKAYIMHHDGTRWVTGTDMIALGPDPYTLVASNVTSFSSFAVQTQPIPRPTTGIYPNPVTRMLNVVIDLPGSQPATISIWDAAGKMVLQQAANLNDGLNLYPINVGALRAGVYFIKVSIKSNPEFMLTRFVKE